MLKILQARLQQYVNRELSDVQAGFTGKVAAWRGAVNQVLIRLTLALFSAPLTAFSHMPGSHTHTC